MDTSDNDYVNKLNPSYNEKSLSNIQGGGINTGYLFAFIFTIGISAF
jgi:hypothetical protein